MNKTMSSRSQTTWTTVSPQSQTTTPLPQYLLRPIHKTSHRSRWQNRKQSHHYQHWVRAIRANIPRHTFFLQVADLQKKPIVGRTIKLTLSPTLSYNYGEKLFSISQNTKILIEAKIIEVERLRPGRSAITALTTNIITSTIKLKLADHLRDTITEQQLVQDLYIPNVNTKFQFILIEDLPSEQKPHGAINKFIIPSAPPQVFPNFIDIPIPPLYR